MIDFFKTKVDLGVVFKNVANYIILILQHNCSLYFWKINKLD